jgi:hypothetical protein
MRGEEGIAKNLKPFIKFYQNPLKTYRLNFILKKIKNLSVCLTWNDSKMRNLTSDE